MIKRVQFHGSLEDLLAVEDVMRILRVSRSKLYLMVHSGDLPVIYIGRRLRFHPEDVKALIERHAANRPRPKVRIRKGRK